MVFWVHLIHVIEHLKHAKHFHFVGIGGIGMSGIARVLLQKGYIVSGSDLNENTQIEHLKASGAFIYHEHMPYQIESADVVVYSTDIAANNPELVAARERHIPVIKRADMLAEVMRLSKAVAISGAHGKTTTTAMIGALLSGAGMHPTIINGGVVNNIETNACLGSGEWCVVEADESDKSFLKLPATIGVVTNIDAEHLNFYDDDFEVLKLAFIEFINKISVFGLAILCHDDVHVRSILPSVNRRYITYGLQEGADIQGFNLRKDTKGTLFDVTVSGAKTITNLYLPMLGEHNVQNVLAAIAVAEELSIHESTMRYHINAFQGVQRRFTTRGIVNGVTIIDDYAHHPKEIERVMQAGRQAAGQRVITVFQPHRYSRLARLMDDFATVLESSDVVVVLPVYSAGEIPIVGVSSAKLVALLKARKKTEAYHVVDPEQELHCVLRDIARAGDIVLCMGAGSITNWAKTLPKRMRYEPAHQVRV